MSPRARALVTRDVPSRDAWFTTSKEAQKLEDRLAALESADPATRAAQLPDIDRDLLDLTIDQDTFEVLYRRRLQLAVSPEADVHDGDGEEPAATVARADIAAAAPHSRLDRRARRRGAHRDRPRPCRAARSAARRGTPLAGEVPPAAISTAAVALVHRSHRRAMQSQRARDQSKAGPQGGKSDRRPSRFSASRRSVAAMSTSLLQLMDELLQAIEQRDAGDPDAPAWEACVRIERLEEEIARRLVPRARTARRCLRSGRDGPWRRPSPPGPAAAGATSVRCRLRSRPSRSDRSALGRVLAGAFGWPPRPRRLARRALTWRAVQPGGVRNLQVAGGRRVASR